MYRTRSGPDLWSSALRAIVVRNQEESSGKSRVKRFCAMARPLESQAHLGKLPDDIETAFGGRDRTALAAAAGSLGLPVLYCFS